jgi:hypothetical protein
MKLILQSFRRRSTTIGLAHWKMTRLARDKQQKTQAQTRIFASEESLWPERLIGVVRDEFH